MEESKQSAQSRASKLKEIMGRVKDREITQKKQQNRVKINKEYMSDRSDQSESESIQNKRNFQKEHDNSSDSSIDSEQLRYLKNKLKKAKQKRQNKKKDAYSNVNDLNSLAKKQQYLEKNDDIGQINNGFQNSSSQQSDIDVKFNQEMNKHIKLEQFQQNQIKNDKFLSNKPKSSNVFDSNSLSDQNKFKIKQNVQESSQSNQTYSFSQKNNSQSKVSHQQEIQSDSESSIDEYQSSIISSRISEILKKDTRESKETVISYIVNIVSLILVMLVYYGLVVILALGLFIYWYDRAYNTNDDAFDNQFNLKYELRTPEEIEASDIINTKSHSEHNHWINPFNLSKVQISVWFAMIPATILVYMNMAVLKMDNHVEYIYFKKENGLKKLKFLKIMSWLQFAVYIAFICILLSGANKEYWKNENFKLTQNYEGLVVYFFLMVQATSLSKYAEYKLKDFDALLKYRQDIIKKYK